MKYTTTNEQEMYRHLASSCTSCEDVFSCKHCFLQHSGILGTTQRIKTVQGRESYNGTKIVY